MPSGCPPDLCAPGENRAAMQLSCVALIPHVPATSDCFQTHDGKPAVSGMRGTESSRLIGGREKRGAEGSRAVNDSGGLGNPF